MEPVRSNFIAASKEFEGKVGFGEIDIDECPEIGKEIPIGNVPTVAYFNEGRLVAALIGSNQDVSARVAAVIKGEEIGYADGRVVGDYKEPSLSTRFLRVLRASVVNPFVNRQR